jgi:hypothetical protein
MEIKCWKAGEFKAADVLAARLDGERAAMTGKLLN